MFEKYIHKVKMSIKTSAKEEIDDYIKPLVPRMLLAATIIVGLIGFMPERNMNHCASITNELYFIREMNIYE